MGRPSKLTDQVIRQMEGRVQSIRDFKALEASAAAADFAGPSESSRPVEDALAFVADIAGTSRAVVQRWVTAGRHALRREDEGATLKKQEHLFARFAEAFDTLRRASAKRVSSTLVTTATQTADLPAQIAAAKIVLPRMDPEGWGPQSQSIKVDVEEHRQLKIEQLPQEVIERLSASPDLLDAIALHEQSIEHHQRAIGEIIASLG